MNTKINIPMLFAAIVILLVTNSGCKRQDGFLAEKTNEALKVPASLTDYQALLENEGALNDADCSLGTIAAEEYTVTDAIYIATSTLTERNAYTWAKDIYQNETGNDWRNLYYQVYVANTVLDGLTTLGVPEGQQSLYNQVKGSALFFRSIAFYNLVQTFALPYRQSAAGTDLGIPLKLSSNLNDKVTRATEQQCYDQILQDLQASLSLLPATTNYKTQPNVIAANAFLARIYLTMGNYPQALQYANICLGLNGSLVNYNTVTPGSYALTAATTYLSEDIFHTTLNNYGIFYINKEVINPDLYQTYDNNDLRKSLFFLTLSGSIRFKGSYEVNKVINDYSGIATDEIYLIRSECNSRLGNISSAVSDLNTLLLNRYKTGTFVPYPASLSGDQLLPIILLERRKELLFRGIRWTDLRRLNLDPKYQVTLSRSVNGTMYTLPPNDPRYAYPIPNEEIQLSGIQQNVR